jgi:hypothetical protein
MARINLYGQNRHVLVLDGVPISGFKDGDWIQIKDEGNAATRTHGGDGPSMNLSTYQGGQITFGLNPTSPVLGPLYALRNQQKNNPRLFSIQLITGVEEVISAAGCAFGELPQFATGGDKMSGRDILIEALQITLDTSATEAISGGLLGGLV